MQPNLKYLIFQFEIFDQAGFPGGKSLRSSMPSALSASSARNYNTVVSMTGV